MIKQNKIEIKSVNDCLRYNLNIPEYQRPYKWSVHNITDLLLDIEHAINESRLYTNFKYRVGTVILHKDGNALNVVDGQQRMISLTLLNYYLDPTFDNSILNNKFTDNITLRHINENYQCIKEWFSLRTIDEKGAFIKAMKNILEVVVIYVDKEAEAFQLFDSQNTRGRALDPHDLLKAYHLREMYGNTYDMECAVNKWEEKDVSKIRELFRDYLFPIWNWSRGRKTWEFTDKDIDTYKGVSIDSTYTFARRTYKAMPYFQITEPFVAGSDFFEMVDHYLQLLKNIESELRKKEDFSEMRQFLEDKHCSVGMKHVRGLYKAAILLYYDRFHILDPLALKKIFMWAFILRVELENISLDSVNKYAVEDRIHNSMPIFAMITQARKHTEIGNIIIKIPESVPGRHCLEERNELLKFLKNMKLKGF
ncbi:MAG: DUF262 domain-containing protein [Bacteroidales bacterium]|nr:DUF262 domain-containing protein [Bacteroidales bacterium]MDY5194697.1 DUF262 domain-containing protein [Candidatus Aphodosoma sp.]